MSEENSQYQVDEIVFQGDISNIYAKLSVIEESSDFDIKEEIKIVEICIEECFECKFKLIQTKDLQENDELLNKTFVELLKVCVNKKFKKVGQIFLVYCDYFDLDYNITFIKLHEKLQNLIKSACKSLIGKNTYNKYVKKTIINQQPVFTLFNLVESRKI